MSPPLTQLLHTNARRERYGAAKMYVIHSGTVGSGFQFASGQAVNRAVDPSPFSDGTLRLQDRHFRDQGFDLSREIPDFFWGTVNVQLPYELALQKPDVTLQNVDWTAMETKPEARIAPETFSFVRCSLAYAGRFHSGLIYYPHPETKPATNAHNHTIVEVLTHKIDGLGYGRPVSVMTRMDAFRPR